MRNRILRLRHRAVWKYRQLRGRGAFVFIAARESAATFTRIAAMRPIMGGSPEGDPPADPPKPKDPPADPPADPPKPKDPPEANKVGEAERLRKKAEKEAEEAKKRVEELEGRDDSETEKERKAREKAERERDAANQRVKELERGGWIRKAAKEAGAIDDDVVVALVDLEQADSEATAEQMVKELAEVKPKLFGQREGGGGNGNGGGGFGTPSGGSPGEGGGSPGGNLPGIGADGTVDKGEVRKGLGSALLGAIRSGQEAGSLSGGEPPDEDD